VNQDRPGADPDRLLVAEITGEARHRARWRPLTEDEEAAALAELRALAGGRADLLAEVAGIFEAPARANRTSRWPGPRRGCAAWPGPMPPPYRAGSRKAAAARRTPGARRSPAA
jgi:hypothetical protein